jgi:hypothetical protein
MSERDELARHVADADDKWLLSMRITHTTNPRIAQWNARIERVLGRLASAEAQQGRTGVSDEVPGMRKNPS